MFTDPDQQGHDRRHVIVPPHRPILRRFDDIQTANAAGVNNNLFLGGSRSTDSQADGNRTRDTPAARRVRP
jgi:hypothetical protein